MKKYITFKNFAFFILIVFAGIQFIRIDKTNPPVIPANDFITINKTPDNIAEILHRVCYDCHSNNSVYPWYSNFAPVSWWLKDHINEGREELNFSEWNAMSAKEIGKKMKRAAKEVKEGEMPLPSYTWVHRNAKLNTEEVALLAEYFTSKISSQLQSDKEEEKD